MSEIYYGDAVTAISGSTGICPQAIGLAMASLVGGVGGEHSGIVGPVGELIRPGFNAIVAGSDCPRWQRAQDLLLNPLDATQRRLREVSRSINLDRLEAMENSKPLQDQSIAVVKQEDNLFEIGGAVWAGMEQRKFEALRQPSYLLRSPTPATLKNGMAEILDHAPLLVFPDGDFIQVRGGKAATDLAATMAAAISGVDDYLPGQGMGLGKIHLVKAKLFATCTERQLHTALTRDDSIQRILMHASMVDLAGTPCPVSGCELGGYHWYKNGVQKVFAARRGGHGMVFKIEPTAHQELVCFQNEIADWIAKLDAELKPFFRHSLALPYRVLWALLATTPTAIYVDHMVQAAKHVVAWALQSQKRLLERATTTRREQERQTMLRKLQRPCTFRELVRRYPDQRKTLHEPVLAELVGAGRVINDAGTFRLNQTWSDQTISSN